MRENVEASNPESEDYKITFDEYKILLEWTNGLANRRQETNNLFFSISSAILTILSLAFYQTSTADRYWGIFISSLTGLLVSWVWIAILGRYREILRFKYKQLQVYEKVLGIEKVGLVSSEENFFKRGVPLDISGTSIYLTPPTKKRRFGITMYERYLPLIFCVLFSILAVFSIFSYVEID